MIETRFTTADSTPHALLLTADELDAVSGGGVTVSFEIPYSWVIYANVASATSLVGSPTGAMFVAGVAAVGAVDGLLNAWAESKMSNTRKSN